LRDDDVEIIEELHRVLQVGKLYHYPHKPRKDGYRRGSRIDWKVVKKADMLKLVEVFDRFPLRARKAEDYRIWREAVMAWVLRKGHRGKRGSRTPHPIQIRLAELKRKLEEGRHYKGVTSHDLIMNV
jgi:hypothetical protein